MKRTTLLQLLTLAQAGCIASIGIYCLIHPNNSLRLSLYIGRISGASGFVYLLATALPLLAFSVAVFWWLGQQKKLVRDLTQERITLPILGLRAKVVLASTLIAVALMSALFLYPRTAPQPTTSYSAPLDELEPAN